VEIRVEHGRARDAGALLTDRRHAAEDDVVHAAGVQLVAVAQAREDLRCEIDRRHFMKRTVRLAAPARTSHMVVDISVCHVAAVPDASESSLEALRDLSGARACRL